jgi:hypothetical protein
MVTSAFLVHTGLVQTGLPQDSTRPKSLNESLLLDLPLAISEAVFDHPSNVAVLRIVEQLVRRLRECASSDDFMAFQRELLAHLETFDRRRAECARMVKRVNGGKSTAGNAIEPPAAGDPSKAESWQAEGAAHARFVRQLRSVGDGFAWRVLRYDRRSILAAADNQSPGPLIKRAGDGTKYDVGLQAEIDALDLHATEGRTAILNSLTNGLRIGDVTVVSPEGPPRFVEIKNNERYRLEAQERRLDRAQATVSNGAPLAGSGMKIIDLSQEYRSDLSALAEVVEIARQTGSRGARLGQGRAIGVTSVLDIGVKTDWSLARASEFIQAERSSALRRSGIDGGSRTVRIDSSDQASRMPQFPPWSIYPFPPDVCALLTCDFLIFETFLSIDHLAAIAREEGLQLDCAFAPGPKKLLPDREVFCLRSGTRRLAVYPNSLALLLHELVSPRVWVRGIRELLDQTNPHEKPWYRFARDDRHWLPRAAP